MHEQEPHQRCFGRQKGFAAMNVRRAADHIASPTPQRHVLQAVGGVSTFLSGDDMVRLKLKTCSTVGTGPGLIEVPLDDRTHRLSRREMGLKGLLGRDGRADLRRVQMGSDGRASMP